MTDQTDGKTNLCLSPVEFSSTLWSFHSESYFHEQVWELNTIQVLFQKRPALNICILDYISNSWMKNIPSSSWTWIAAIKLSTRVRIWTWISTVGAIRWSKRAYVWRESRSAQRGAAAALTQTATVSSRRQAGSGSSRSVSVPLCAIIYTAAITSSPSVSLPRSGSQSPATCVCVCVCLGGQV